MYKLIAIDIDGTLLTDDHKVTDEVKEAIRQAKLKGVKVVLCTGRPLVGVENYLTDLELREEGDYVISFNGAFVQDTFTKEVISHLTLGIDDLKEIYQMSLDSNLHMHFFDDKALYTPNREIGKYTIVEAYLTGSQLIYKEIENVPEDFIMSKAMFIEEAPELEVGIAKIPESFREKYHLVRSTPFYLEILNRDASKGNAVKELSEKLGIKQSEVICIGDQENDVPMLEFAGLGIAMGNAPERIKQLADYTTASNNDSGVAKAIQKFVLDK
ncbi:hydrolase, haloacid dehalogenase-like family [Listeria monocytogenes serotype 7 str. SLCC2482]|uniref:sugar-phosphatase n=1 Tax=Listeria monocytogenes TaxID=1639 RepID=UPI00027E81A1|nr:sugar-phosphatase [Listeria monocytogenes]EEP3936050.1 sugar-phosphatase [Listeria monocytogenes serotype 7]EAG0856473.1 sugar-phosphatase [Listeria monocytogenes]EJB6296889.1 sugar-phosphatase [Listeria monocytogenes]QOF57093.1 sugar-phosphatase [Listeria monocytogenes]CBY02800.1 hydrolase, haloacid dehalogenase-like family [Listeria monocytogenes serotype 7 str. SLCC2482]